MFSVAAAVLLLTALVLTPASVLLRDAAAGSVAGYAALLAVLYALVVLPIAWYRSCHLDRLYGLSAVTALAWLREYAKSTALAVPCAAVAAEALYLAMRAVPSWWWLLAAAGGTALLGILTSLAPVVILPLFHRSRPLDRETLRQRLFDLSSRAGISVLSVHELGVGHGTRRAHAALVGAGATRRILLSDTLLADYNDDEIEVVIAHEIGHHVHRDVMKGLIGEFLVLLCGAGAAAAALAQLWRPLGLRSPHDVAGLPLVLLAAGAVVVAATPLLNAWSRRNERQADRFALEMTSRPDAFIGAMRRMAAQNMAEERPTFAARWFFGTHPGVEERISRARRMLEDRN